MIEHKICEECKYNKYPECLGTILEDGSFMNIEYLKNSFECGQKDQDNLMDFSIKYKTELELRVEELENKITILEEVKR
ncbi:unnamed protein product [marine sediment metagenome]|uniref:Uncharacterized protein n=1 Tax=marine sediment metagenome TaxID=412755 RepID=X0YCG6_9ZZZZ